MIMPKAEFLNVQVLTPEQLAEFNSIQSVPDTDAVLIFTAELDLRRRSQKGKSIASRLFPVLQAVHNFTAVIDTFISSNPTIAALVWGSVKLTMQIMLNAASYYEAFAELFMNLGTICPRFEQYQALFPNSERLQTALCNFNASIIRCCQHVIDMPKSGSGWTSPLNPLNASFWQSFQQAFESNLQELRDYSKNVKEEIRLAQAQSEYRNRELQRIEQDQAEKSRLSLGRFMSRTRDDFDTMRQSQVLRNQQLEREKNQKLLDSLSSHDYLKPLKQARQKRYPQSADWIFDTGEFKRWAEGTAARFLWCSGKMGSGKTILAASVIDYLLTKPSQAGSRVTFFFSRFDELESLTAETTLRAIAKQLIYPRDISDYIKQALEKVQNANGEVLSQVSELFIHLLSKGSRTTWIILDGLDEFPRDERRKLIDVLGSILLVPEVKMFATGRDQADSILARANPGLERLSMNCPLGKSGMEELVNQAVQNCLDAEELLRLDAWFQGLVEIDHETKTVHLVHASVQQFFQTVPDKPNLAKFHVQAKEADLHLGEICVTYLNFNDFKTTLSRRRPPLPPMAPDEICAQALSCEWSWAKLLILSRGIPSGRRRAADIDGVVASYARASDATVQETIINDHPFILAAREGLLGIVQMLVKGGVDINAGMPDSHGVPFNLPLMASIETGQIGIMEYLLQNGANPNSRTTSYRNALEPAAELGGFEGIQACQMLINAGAKPESGEQEPTAQSTLGYNALQRACRRGEFEITRLLLDAGADANGTPKAAKADFPLQLSIRSENIPIIDILISHGADVNVQTSDGDAITPLLKACSLESPRLVIVQLLIRAGAKATDKRRS
ncbi:hypothetical protein FocTR4_00003962 [Fusarium oxysporum f. sp. cubense]|uniref:NACHT domain-containing protein n=1 Tax=Fusarium oxysporum f. sp. cubense TaxID=61366 RepID=A0A5C6TAY6_FUSOC|nr:hypothetical protein FocTR4_00003962 [Fusarium oxysporum f. sp. cubense]